MADRGRGGRDRGRGRGRGDGPPRGGRGGGAFNPAGPGRGSSGDRGSFRGGSDRGAFRGGSDRGAFRGGSDRGAFRGGFDRGRGGGGRGGRPPAQTYKPRDGPPPDPDVQVTTVEDARQKARQSPSFAMGALGLGSDKAVMPPRPGYGSDGAKIVVYANYVQLHANPDLNLYSYDISDISPEVAGKKRTQVIRLLIEEADELKDYRKDMVTDFRSTLISRKKLDLEGEPPIITVTYKNEGEDTPTERATQYKVKLTNTKTLTVGDVISYLTSTNPANQYDKKLDMIQALNIFLKHYAKSTDNLATIGASKTFSMGAGADRYDLGGGLTALRGFFTSVRAATNRLLVNINVSHGAFYQEGLLTALINAFNPQFSERGMRALEKFLKRVRVRTTHLKVKKNKKGDEVHRTKAIVALAKKSDGRRLDHPPRVSETGAGPKNVEFWLESQPPSSSSPSVPGAGPSQPAPTPKKGKGKGGKAPAVAGPQPPGAGAGRYVSVHDHFKNTYNITTSNDYPVVNVGTEQNPSYLPAEVCVVLPGQSAMAKLSGDQTRNMISFAVRGPWMNAESIVNNGFQTAGLSPLTNQLLAQYGLRCGQGLITVPARVLPEPKVFYRNNKPVNGFNGSWNMDKIQFNKPGQLKTWSWISLVPSGGRAPRYSFDEVQRTVDKFGPSLLKNGVAAQKPLNGQELGFRYPTDPAIDDRFKAAAAHGIDLLLIVLPGRDKSDNTELYNTIKTLGDTKYGIHTICVVGQKFVGEKGQDQYFANVALKFNLKLGGNNQMVEPARLSFIQEDKTMLVGIDVTHPSPGSSDKAPSVAGMVASIDKHLGQWPGILSVQAVARQEMVSDIETMLMQHLDNWKTLGKHAQFPENIIVYRDGVSEGQYQTVLDTEVKLLRSACAAKYPPPMTKQGFPRLSVIIVGKRHHTRFYPRDDKDMDRGGNCKPGTVVDRGVTEEGFWDFFLQSHAAIQGTARPAHYVVVLDEIFRSRAKAVKKPDPFPANELERMTQALCYSYSRATKAVSICTPAYHADILCERSRRYMADLFEGTVSDEASTVSGGGGSVGDGMRIHERLKNTMFYI